MMIKIRLQIRFKIDNQTLKLKILAYGILWLNGVLRRFNQYFSHITATAHIIHAFLGFTGTRLGSEVSCPRTLPRKNPEDPVRLEPRTPGLRVKHFTTVPRGTPAYYEAPLNQKR